MKLITLDYFVFTGSCQWKTKSDPYVQEEKKDLDRIICATKCAKNQDLTVNIKSVLEKKNIAWFSQCVASKNNIYCHYIKLISISTVVTLS